MSLQIEKVFFQLNFCLFCILPFSYYRILFSFLLIYRMDLAHLVLYHLSLCCKRKYFDFDHEILSFTNENWDSLLLGAVLIFPRLSTMMK